VAVSSGARRRADLDAYIDTVSPELEGPGAEYREILPGRVRTPSGSLQWMRIVVTGGTGNVGTSVLRALRADPSVDSIVGLARRRPSLQQPKTEWAAADVTSSDLVPLFRGADAVIHLAWLIQPSHDPEKLRRTNVLGSARVLQAVADARVPALVVASAVGAYSPGPQDRAVDEHWPTEGVPTSFYARHKAAVERMLDAFEPQNPEVNVARLRPGITFMREAGSEVKRLFLGPLVPAKLLRPGLIPLVPHVRGLRFQAVHSHDVGEAYRLATVAGARGAFNIAADPVLDTRLLAKLLGAKLVPIPARLIRFAIAVTWHLRLQPTPPGWVDMALASPVMDTRRARTELGWEPRHSAADAVLEILQGLSERAATKTPPLSG
jgi:nucleoside-diphosphate-sugar epimerase